MSYDDAFIKSTNTHELEMEMQKTRQLDINSERRRAIFTTLIVSFSVVALLLGGVIVFWLNTEQTRQDEFKKIELKHQETMACIERGGTMLTAQSEETCFFITKPEDAIE